MIRKPLQVAFCLILAPLLIAQQTGPIAPQSNEGPTQSPVGAGASASNSAKAPARVTIPQDTKIELIVLENVSTETAIKGSSVRFAVGKDVAVNGVTVVRAGAPVNGIVSKATRGVPGRQSGRLDICVNEIGIGRGARLRLTSSDPKTRRATGWRVKDTLEGYGMCALGLPLCLILIAVLRSGTPIGQQVVLPQCHAVDYWVKSATKVKRTDLPQSTAKSTVPNLEGCSSLIDSHAKAQASSSLHNVRFE